MKPRGPYQPRMMPGQTPYTENELHALERLVHTAACEDPDESREDVAYVGYTDCPCRDCMEISMDHEMCSDCEAAGCDGTGECSAPGAYEGCEKINELPGGE